MDINNLLSRLDGVRQTGTGRWLARCPAHDDKNPSLSIGLVEDRILLNCFAGCPYFDVVNTVGLESSDLFPENLKKVNKKISKPFPAKDILKAIRSELSYIIICVSDMTKGEVLSPEDVEKLRKVIERFNAALLAGGIS